MLLGELAGLQLSGEYGCAHSLIDKVVQMIEDDVLRCLGVTSARNKNKRCRMFKKKGRELKSDARCFVRKKRWRRRMSWRISRPIGFGRAWMGQGLSMGSCQARLTVWRFRCCFCRCAAEAAALS
jgi:hypothetical protein